MTTHYIVHDETDTVGVVVVEGVTKGDSLTGWLMASDATLQATAKDDIPLGHKIALGDLGEGDTVLKYGHDIGRIVKDVQAGGHVHVQNLKTKRW